MSFKSNLLKAAGIGAAGILLTAGAAFAATATASVNVRTGPGTSYGVVDTLAPGENVAIVGQSNGWCRVDKPGPNGWVSCAYLAGGGGGAYYGGPRYDQGPDVSFSFGFGTPYPRHHYVRPSYPAPMHSWWW
jgi:uncharacterized protein YraI